MSDWVLVIVIVNWALLLWIGIRIMCKLYDIEDKIDSLDKQNENSRKVGA